MSIRSLTAIVPSLALVLGCVLMVPGTAHAEDAYSDPYDTDGHVVFSYHTRRNDHPAGGISVSSVSTDYTYGQPDTYYCMVNNGTIPKESSRTRLTLVEEEDQLIPEIPYRDNTGSSPEVVQSGDTSDTVKDFFITRGNIASQVKTTLYGSTRNGGYRPVAVMNGVGDLYRAPPSSTALGDRPSELSFQELRRHRAILARWPSITASGAFGTIDGSPTPTPRPQPLNYVVAMVGDATVTQPDTSKNAGAHAVMTTTSSTLTSVTLEDVEGEEIHQRAVNYQFSAWDNLDENITQRCSWEFNADWGKYYQSIEEWANINFPNSVFNASGTDTQDIRIAWDMGNPRKDRVKYISSEYYGEHYTSSTVLEATATDGSDSAKNDVDVTVSKGTKTRMTTREQAGTRMIGDVKKISEPIKTFPENGDYQRKAGDKFVNNEQNPVIEYETGLFGEIFSSVWDAIDVVKKAIPLPNPANYRAFSAWDITSSDEVTNLKDSLLGKQTWNISPFTITALPLDPQNINGPKYPDDTVYAVKLQLRRVYFENTVIRDETTHYDSGIIESATGIPFKEENTLETITTLSQRPINEIPSPPQSGN